MTGQTAILQTERNRAYAKALIDAAPEGAVVNIKPPSRTREQNDRMWCLLSDVSRHKPEGRHWPPETWKAAFMHSLGYQCLFERGLDGSGPFPLGFRTSKLNKAQMADLITVIYEYGDRHGVVWSEKVT